MGVINKQFNSVKQWICKRRFLCLGWFTTSFVTLDRDIMFVSKSALSELLQLICYSCVLICIWIYVCSPDSGVWYRSCNLQRAFCVNGTWNLKSVDINDIWSFCNHCTINNWKIFILILKHPPILVICCVICLFALQDWSLSGWSVGQLVG